jgi:hypothetical protein
MERQHLQDVTGEFFRANHASLFLCVLSAALTAVGMHPNVTSLMIFILNLGLLGTIRIVAHLEGRGHL